MSNEIAPKQSGALAQASGRMAVADIISHVALVQEVMRAVMKPDIHYGVIPGTDKPTLLKQGAEVLCMAFRVADSYQVEDLSTADTVRYRVTCIGTHQASGVVLGSGMGAASSGEAKYKWVKAYQEEWDATPENLRRKKFGWDKNKRQKYEVLQVRTDPADLDNTILKMANKRAKIAMTINVTACGDMFGQDLEDMDEALRDHLTRHGKDQQNDPQPQAHEELQPYSTADFTKNLTAWRNAIASGKTTPDNLIAMVSTKGVLSEAQKQGIRDLAKPQDVTDAPIKNEVPAEPAMSAAEQEAHAEFLAEMGD
jgi:hypothetical protein